MKKEIVAAFMLLSTPLCAMNVYYPDKPIQHVDSVRPFDQLHEDLLKRGIVLYSQLKQQRMRKEKKGGVWTRQDFETFIRELSAYDGGSLRRATDHLARDDIIHHVDQYEAQQHKNRIIAASITVSALSIGAYALTHYFSPFD